MTTSLHSRPSRSEYDIVAQVLVVVDHTTSWEITGLRVAYDVGSDHFTTVLAQSVTLSPMPVCS